MILNYMISKWFSTIMYLDSAIGTNVQLDKTLTNHKLIVVSGKKHVIFLGNILTIKRGS